MNPTKIHPRLLDELSLSARTMEMSVSTVEERQFPVIVRLREARSLDDMSGASVHTHMRVERRIDLVASVAGVATREEIEELSESAMVEIIWSDEPVFALLDTSVPLIGAPPVWRGGNEGAGVRICIVDTGIDVDHPDFAGRVAAAQDFTGEGPGDGSGHGTHVAGTVAGSGSSSEGRYRGVAPAATILSAKVLRSDGTGRMSMVMAGIEWAVEQGAQVINLSLGSRGNCDGTDATSVTCDAAVEAGAVVVVACGNDGPRGGTVGSPGCARNVITVGAIMDDGSIADFSSRGPTRDARVKPDVVLPGVDIVAPRARGTSIGRPVDMLYSSMNGTSMACPHAAGIAALMLAANPDLRPATVKRIMMSASRSLGQDENAQGSGLVEAARAVEFALAERPAPAPTPEPPPEPPPAPEPDPPPASPPQPAGCFAPLARMFGRG